MKNERIIKIKTEALDVRFDTKMGECLFIDNETGAFMIIDNFDFETFKQIENDKERFIYLQEVTIFNIIKIHLKNIQL